MQTVTTKWPAKMHFNFCHSICVRTGQAAAAAPKKDLNKTQKYKCLLSVRGGGFALKKMYTLNEFDTL